MSVLTVAAARNFLGIDVTTYDAKLQEFIDSAEAAIAEQVGPLTPVEVTERVAGYGYGLSLPIFPAVSLTSVTPVSGTALDPTTLYLDKRRGRVTRNDGGQFTTWAYDVVYQAGRDPVPDDLVQAVKEKLYRLWETQRSSNARRPGASTPAPDEGPDRIEELIKPHRQITLGA